MMYRTLLHSLLLLSALPLLSGAEKSSKLLFDFSGMQTGIRKMGTSNYEIRNGTLNLHVPADSPKWSGILVKDPSGKGFSTKGYSAIAFDVRNRTNGFSGELQVELICLDSNKKWRYRSKGGVALRQGCRSPRGGSGGRGDVLPLSERAGRRIFPAGTHQCTDRKRREIRLFPVGKPLFTVYFPFPLKKLLRIPQNRCIMKGGERISLPFSFFQK